MAGLRARIGRMGVRGERLRFGVAALDRHLGGGLLRGRLHEFAEASAAAEHAAAATLFVAGILARTRGPVLWCLRRRDLFAPALGLVGLHPDRVVYAEAAREADLLACLEEGLRHPGLAGVVGEVARLGLTPSRRLKLAAEASGVTAFVVRRWRSDAERAAGAEPNAAETRWRLGAAPSAPLAAAVPGVGRARWSVELVRARGAEPRAWIVEACDGKGRLALPADLGDRPGEAARRAAAG